MSPSEMEFIKSRGEQKSLSKGQYLLKEGDICDEFIIITKGITRVYLVDDAGKEVTVWFGFAATVGSDVQSFISEQPSRFFVQVIDDLEYLAIPKTTFLKISDTIPAWDKFQAKLWSDCVVHIIDRVMGYQHRSAEERYLELQQNSKYFQLIPQKYLASFLGITHTSLSRLRKQIYTKMH